MKKIKEIAIEIAMILGFLATVTLVSSSVASMLMNTGMSVSISEMIRISPVVTLLGVISISTLSACLGIAAGLGVCVIIEEI